MISTKFLKILFLLIVAVGMAGCAKEYGGGKELSPSAKGDQVTITVNIPAPQTPTTRSIADAGGEATVKTIDILVFKSDGTLTERVAGQIVSQSEISTEKYKVTFKAALTVNADARAIAIVANAVIPSSVIAGEAKKNVLTALTHSSTGKWNAISSTNYTPIPMYGEAAVASGITAGMTIENIELTRMLARIDLTNTANNFTVTNVYLANYNSAGYIATAWDADGTLESSLPETPMVPASNDPQTGGAKASVYGYSGSGLVGEIYTYEAAATSGIEGNATHTNAVCLIVEGVYGGKTYFYRIDFTHNKDAAGIAPDAAGFNPASVSYMPVYRNHLYDFTIETVNGVGFATLDAALNSLGMMNNLKTSLHVVDQSGIKNMVFNGQHYLGVGEGITLDGHVGSIGEVLCKTNYADGWKIDRIEYVIGTDWLNAIKSGDNIALETMSINGYLYDQVANVHISAGKLTHILQIKQSTGYYPAYPNVIGYDPETEKLTIDGTGFMVHFKFGSVIGMYAAVNGDTWSVDDVAFNPSDVIVTPDYESVPYTASITFPIQNTSNIIAGKGDPCKLVGLSKEEIADGTINNGKWRLPTGNPSYENLESAIYIYEINGSDIPKSDGKISKYQIIGDAKYIQLGVITLIGTAAQTTYEGTTLTLPTGGYRSWSTGVIDGQFYSGFFRTTSAVDESEGHYLSTNSLRIHAAGCNYHSYGFSVRCVRQ